MKKTLSKAKNSRVGRFGALGVINTILDFIILNILRVATDTTSEQVTKLVVLNIVSASAVATFSFFMNRRYVFKSKASRKRIVPFITFTLFGIFVLQSLTISISLPLIKPIAEVFYNLFYDSWVPIIRSFTINFYETNGAKIIATAVTMIWNYTMYKKVVFKDPTQDR